MYFSEKKVKILNLKAYMILIKCIIVLSFSFYTKYKIARYSKLKIHNFEVLYWLLYLSQKHDIPTTCC